jgi:hypothetical protein
MSNGVNPQKSLFIHGQDIDRVVALMCYVQLCIWHIPCEICIGDTLKNEKREIWHSPAYHLGLWENRLRFDREKPTEDSSVNFILIGDTYTDLQKMNKGMMPLFIRRMTFDQFRI